MSSSLLDERHYHLHHYQLRTRQRGSETRNSRGLPLTDKDAGQGQLEGGLHHFNRQRFQRQRQVDLGGRGTGKALQVDVS